MDKRSIEKPRGLSEKYASQWEDPAMAEAYPCRPPYPAAVFDLLADLSEGGAVLDLGCGTGDIARPLAARVVGVRAVDRAAPMIALARTLPGGDAPNLTWVVGRAEDENPAKFATTTVGESLHWFDWDRLPELPRLTAVGRIEHPSAWTGDLRTLIPQYSTNRDFVPYDALDSLAQAKRFTERGSARLPATPFTQTITDYIASIHSRNGFSPARMTNEARAAFDAAARAVLAPHADGKERLTFGVGAMLRWGHVSAGSSAGFV